MVWQIDLGKMKDGALTSAAGIEEAKGEDGGLRALLGVERTTPSALATRITEVLHPLPTPASFFTPAWASDL